MEKIIFGYGLKGTEKQLEEMYDLLNCEDYVNPRFQKYFYVWVYEGLGVFWFPKERYFVSYNGETHYPLALFYYGAPLGDKKYNYHYSDYDIKYR